MSSKNRTGKASQPAKKKNVAKHVLAAADRQKAADLSRAAAGESDDEAGADAAAVNLKNEKKREAAKAAKKAKGKKNKHKKPPSEAGNYLVLWRLHQKDAASSGWKFNKNTQSWLLRHMYNDKQVSKGSFKHLLEYMEGLQGKGKEETAERALELAEKYKEWAATEKGKEEEAVKGEERADGEQFSGSNFDELDAHAKRKVYKRARQVYEALKD